MKGTKLLFSLTTVASLSGLAHAFFDVHAREMLQRCMEKTLNVNVRAIVCQRCLDSNQVLQIKVEQSRSGKSRMTIIAPIDQQGVELVDDGSVMTTFDPDTRQTEVRMSRRRRDVPSVNQVSLADRNYVLSLAGHTRVAGRPALIVNAVPRFRGMPSRKYFIDTETAYLLRLDLSGPAGGAMTTSFDTVSVSYPSAIVEPTARASHQDVMTAYARTKMMNKELNFCGYAPSQLPMGFTVQQVEALGDSGRAVRVTDGLVRGMVYQWKRKAGEGAPDNNPNNWQDVGDYRILIALDVPQMVRDRVKAAFIASMDPGTTTLLYTQTKTSGTSHSGRRVQE